MKQNNNYKQDYVTGLLTGRLIGKEFLPNKLNPYPTLNEIMRDNDLTKNEALKKENLVLPLRSINFEVFKKTDNEKLALRRAKKEYKNSITSDKDKSEFLKLFKDRLPSWGDSSKLKIKLNFKIN